MSSDVDAVKEATLQTTLSFDPHLSKEIYIVWIIFLLTWHQLRIRKNLIKRRQPWLPDLSFIHEALSPEPGHVTAADRESCVFESCCFHLHKTEIEEKDNTYFRNRNQRLHQSNCPIYWCCIFKAGFHLLKRNGYDPSSIMSEHILLFAPSSNKQTIFTICSFCEVCSVKP